MSAPVVVVGGSRGLGFVVARDYAMRGEHVLVLSRTPPAEIAAYANMRHVAVDLDALASPAAAAALAAAVPAVRYLIFCQRFRGTPGQSGGEMQTSVHATQRIIELLQPAFISSGDRAIALVSSNFAQWVGNSQGAEYHAAKAAVNQLGRYYAVHLGAARIRVNVVMPFTYIKPESAEFFAANTARMQAYEKLVPLGRLGTAGDISGLIGFLCSEQASFITGQCIAIDGGVSALWPEDLLLPLYLQSGSENTLS